MTTDWFKLAAAMIAVGFQLEIFATALSGIRGNDTIEGLLISGFVAYIFAFMIVLFVNFGGFGQHKVATVFLIIFAFCAAILPMAGLGIYIDEHNSDPEKYSATIMCSAAILAVLGGIFSICGLAGC